MRREYFVYILSNPRRTVLYIGVTNSLSRRYFEHKDKVHPNSFTSRYNVGELVYFEIYSSIYDAIGREKQLKGWVRRKKDALIFQFNPTLKNLFAAY